MRVDPARVMNGSPAGLKVRMRWSLGRIRRGQCGVLPRQGWCVADPTAWSARSEATDGLANALEVVGGGGSALGSYVDVRRPVIHRR